jgi:hypothetical protein
VWLRVSRIKCYTRCYAGIYARSCATCTSQLPPGSCDPPVSDPRPMGGAIDAQVPNVACAQ